MKPPAPRGRLVAAVREAHRALLARHPHLRFLERWGLSLASLANGIVILVAFRRGTEHLPWIVGVLFLLWFGVVVFEHVRRSLAARGRQLVLVALDYTIQSLHHTLLLSLLPIYYASTTLASPNATFLLLLAGAVLLTSVDPWYRATIRLHPRAIVVLFAFCFFAALAVALPLVGLRSTWALIASGALSMLALTPAIRRATDTSWRTAWLLAGLAAAVAASVLWPLRRWIPPAPLHLAFGTFARTVERREPVQPVVRISAADLKAWGSVWCFTAVWAPAGLREPITHAWSRDGVPVASTRLAPIRGGRPGGFRTYSRRTDLGPDPTGHWTVDVLTAHGQLIGRVRLTVTR